MSQTIWNVEKEIRPVKRWNIEEEAIYILREVAGQFRKPVLLFSGGKDSLILAHLAVKAFLPGKVPFPLLHIDTGHNFPETIAFRDEFANRLGFELIVRKVQDSIDSGRVQEESGPFPSRNRLQSVTLLDAIAELKFDAAIGGARRDEEKARAKERVFSHRNAAGQWDPKAQRPELWHLYNGLLNQDETCRIFPLSNWTEADVWQYIVENQLEIPSLYFSHQRQIVHRDGQLIAITPFTPPQPGERVETLNVRFRTVGDATCTGAVASEASNVKEVLREVLESNLTERSGRNDDHRTEAAMEDRKREGYF